MSVIKKPIVVDHCVNSPECVWAFSMGFTQAFKSIKYAVQTNSKIEIIKDS